MKWSLLLMRLEVISKTLIENGLDYLLQSDFPVSF